MTGNGRCSDRPGHRPGARIPPAEPTPKAIGRRRNDPRTLVRLRRPEPSWTPPHDDHRGQLIPEQPVPALVDRDQTTEQVLLRGNAPVREQGPDHPESPSVPSSPAAETTDRRSRQTTPPPGHKPWKARRDPGQPRTRASDALDAPHRHTTEHPHRADAPESAPCPPAREPPHQPAREGTIPAKVARRNRHGRLPDGAHHADDRAASVSAVRASPRSQVWAWSVS